MPLVSSREPAVPPSVLLVEDDPAVRALILRALSKYGYRVIDGETATKAIEIASDAKVRIDLVVTDVVMPGMNGREMLERLHASRPGLRHLFISGYTDDEVVKRGVLRGETSFLQKPFTPAQLAVKVKEVLDPPPS